MTKADIRKEILAKRDSLTETEQSEKSRQIFERLLTLEEYKYSRNILVYANFGSEVKTDEIILDSLAMGKNVFCPKITDHTNGIMIFAKIESLENMVTGFYGMREPDIDEFSIIYKVNDSLDGDNGRTLIILPGVAFDHKLNRIGYKGGFYDRFLEKNPDTDVVAIAYDAQVIDFEIPFEFHDKKPQKIVTESRIIEANE